MSQNTPHPCIKCGFALLPGQRFCSNCGTNQDIRGPEMQAGSRETLPASGATPSYNSPPYQQGYQQPGQPGGAQGYQQGGQIPYPQAPYQQGYQQPWQTSSNAGAAAGVGIVGAILGLLLLRRVGSRAVGCFVWIIILGAIFACVFASRSQIAQRFSSTTQTSYSSSTDGNGTPVSTIAKSTVPLNATFVYSGITTTIMDVQQAPSYADDPPDQSAGLLRVDLHEQTATLSDVVVDYNSAYQLIAPDGTTIEVFGIEHDSTPDQSVSRMNWLDFPIAKNVQVSQYTLKVGTADEAQINVPLTGKVNLSQYAPRKATPNKAFVYGGINFTLTDATAELSENGPQAKKGMMYVVVDLTINNNTANTFYGDLTDIRLQSGATSSPPADFLDTISPGQTNVQASLVFTMPQGSTNFSLVFLPSTDNNAPTQATTAFQIP